MRGDLRLAAVLVTAGVLLGTHTQATGAPQPPPAPPAPLEVDAPRARIGIATGLQAAQTQMLGVRQGLVELDRSLAPLEDAIRQAETAMTVGVQRLRRRASAARGFVATWTPSEAPSVEELSEPLELVASALHAGTDLRAVLASREGDLIARRTELDRIHAEVRATAFALADARAALERDLVLARRISWDAGTLSSDPLLPRISSALAEGDQAAALLRQGEARIANLSVLLTQQQVAVTDALREARATEDALVTDMLSAESAIGPYLGSLDGGAWGPFDPSGVFQVCPVDMPNAYTDDWGAPRYSGGYHPHQGNDIFAPVGTPIRAPFAGTAVTAENALGGLAVKVIGPLGYVYNAHLLSYGKLGEVQAGDIIGYVGNTGNARYTAAHDHFEWHPGGGDAVDPFLLLNAACRPLG